MKKYEEGLISIIIPVYNVEKYLVRCIESIINQTYSKLEIIIVNDGSTDNSKQICEKYLLKDKRIKLINKVNGGLSSARNTGMKIASGEYIAFVDSDDYIELDMYEDLYYKINENKADIAISGRIDVYNENQEENFTLKEEIILTSEQAIKKILLWEDLDSSSCDKLFKIKLWQDIRFPEGRVNEDIFVMYKIFHKANRIIHIGKAKYYYVHREGSITSAIYSEKKEDFPKVADEMMEFINTNYKELNNEMFYFFYRSRINIIDLILNGDDIKNHKNTIKKYSKDLKNNFENLVSNKFINKKEKMKLIGLCLSLKLFTSVMNKYYKIRCRKNG